MTPGCLNVRSFLTAFFAIGRRDLFAVTSKENILQIDPSSYSNIRILACFEGCWSYTFGSIIESPDAGVYVDSVAKSVGKWRAF